MRVKFRLKDTYDLKMGKVYEVIEKGNLYLYENRKTFDVKVVNDKGELDWVAVDHFEVIEDER